MLGYLIGSLVIGLCVGVAMYFLYGTDRFRPTVGANRLRAAIFVGAGVAIVGFLMRWLGWL